ncbi:hypothetical protein Tco_1029281 [Tanacetum coccineum]|uniref:Uncharacterized protein n=1 Tax=Tanacetum coccineum TaxID=301880 RepID=A0ABQ5G2Z1_9ASTR
MAFVSSPNNNTSNTNEAVNTAHGVSTASTQVNAANSTNIDNLSDAVIYDMEGGDLRWQMRHVDYEGKEGSAKLQEIKTTRTRKAHDGVCSVETFLLSTALVSGEITIRELRKKLELAQKEKDGIQLNVDKFEHASKSLNKLIECHIVDNCKKYLGYENYNAVPPPYIGNFMPPTHDLSFTGLDEFVNEHVVENFKAMSSEEEPKVVRKCDNAPSIEEWVSDDEEEDVSQPKTEKKTVRPSIVKKEFVKFKQQEKTVRKTVKQVDCNYHQKQFQNQRMVKPVWNNAQRVNHQNFAKKTHPCAKKNLVPRAVLMKSGLVSINTARQNISKTAVLVNTARQNTDFKFYETIWVDVLLPFFKYHRSLRQNLMVKADEGSGPDWLFDIDALTRTINYEPIIAGTQSNGFAGTKASDNAGQARKETELKEDDVNNTNNVNTVSSTVNAAGTNEVNVVGGKTSIKLPFDPNMPTLEDDSIFDFSSDDEDDGAMADMNNLDTTIQVSPNLTTRIHKDHPLDQVIGDLQSATQTRKESKEFARTQKCPSCIEGSKLDRGYAGRASTIQVTRSLDFSGFTKWKKGKAKKSVKLMMEKLFRMELELMLGKTSPSTLIGGDPRKNDTVDMKEAQGNKAYTLEVHTKEAQPVTITDCHTSNPCELEIDLTAKSSSPIIEGMYGQDWKERAET